jgi:type IV fimbrial biogenesis protein FimT
MLDYQKRRHMLKASRGYSLLELAIAMVIFGFALAIGYPNFSEWLTNLKIRAAAEKAQSSIQFARSEALRKNTPISFYLVTSLDNSCALSSTGTYGVVARSSPAGACASAASEVSGPMIARKERLAEGQTTISGASGASGASSLTFNGFGRVVTGGTWIKVMDVNSPPSGTYRRLRIKVAEGGGSKLCDPAVSSSVDPRNCG